MWLNLRHNIKYLMALVFWWHCRYMGQRQQWPVFANKQLIASWLLHKSKLHFNLFSVVNLVLEFRMNLDKSIATITKMMVLFHFLIFGYGATKFYFRSFVSLLYAFYWIWLNASWRETFLCFLVHVGIMKGFRTTSSYVTGWQQ